MTRYGLLLLTLLSGALFAGCSGECSSAFDCKSTEVCFKEICTPATASYLSCNATSDCADDPNFECRGGICRVIGGSTGPVVDAGNGPVDTGIVADGGGGVDTGISDTGTATTADAGP
jgi:hypothetical protein